MVVFHFHQERLGTVKLIVLSDGFDTILLFDDIEGFDVENVLIIPDQIVYIVIEQFIHDA